MAPVVVSTGKLQQYQALRIASWVMLVFKDLEIGQFVFASSTQVLNTSREMPLTWAVTFKCELVIAPFSRVTVQTVSMLVGSNPAAPNMKLSFMLKQPA